MTQAPVHSKDWDLLSTLACASLTYTLPASSKNTSELQLEVCKRQILSEEHLEKEHLKPRAEKNKRSLEEPSDAHSKSILQTQHNQIHTNPHFIVLSPQSLFSYMTWSAFKKIYKGCQMAKRKKSENIKQLPNSDMI